MDIWEQNIPIMCPVCFFIFRTVELKKSFFFHFFGVYSHYGARPSITQCGDGIPWCCDSNARMPPHIPHKRLEI